MSAVLERANIQTVIREAESVSFTTKPINISEQEKIDRHLDEIREVRDAIDDTVAKLLFIVEKSEELTWYKITEPEVLDELRHLVDVIVALRKYLRKPYAEVARKFTKQRIFLDKVHAFKSALDDLEEAAEDLRTAFLDELSPSEDYSDLNEQLSQLDGDSLHSDV